MPKRRAATSVAPSPPSTSAWRAEQTTLYTRYYPAALHALRGDLAMTEKHLEKPLAELGPFTRWRLPRDPDFDAVRDQLVLPA